MAKKHDSNPANSMVITWYGQYCFKIQSGDTTIVTDPFSKETGLTPPRFKADILTLSNHGRALQKESIPDGHSIIEGPGEYEVKGVLLYGSETYRDASEGKERGLNTAYRIELEGISLCHLGDLGEEKLRGETIEAIGNIDILLLPIGGHGAIDGKQAKKIIDQIEPRLVIPMGYAISGLKTKADVLDVFLKEMGIKNPTHEERLTIKKKELPETEDTKVVILKAA